MGVFKVTIEFGDAKSEPFEPTDGLVETGATYTLMPGAVLRSLSIDPMDRGAFELAGGILRDYPIGQTQVRVDGREVTTLVVFGDEHSQPLLAWSTTADRCSSQTGKCNRKLWKRVWQR